MASKETKDLWCQYKGYWRVCAATTETYLIWERVVVSNKGNLGYSVERDRSPRQFQKIPTRFMNITQATASDVV